MLESKPAVECTPVRWRVLAEFYPTYGHVAGGIYVETRMSRDGKVSYAIVMREHYEFSKMGQWDSQPIPSERDDTYLADHRWTTVEAAMLIAQKEANRILAELLHAAN